MPKLYPLLALLLGLNVVGCDETVSTIVTLQLIFPEDQNPLDGVERLRARVVPTDGSDPVGDEIPRPDSGWDDLDEGIDLGHMDIESATVVVEGLAGDGEVLSVGETIPIPIMDGHSGRAALFVQRIGTSGLAPGPEWGWSHHCATYLTGGGVMLAGGADGAASTAAWVYAVDLYEPVELSPVPAARSLAGCATLGEHTGLLIGGSQPSTDAYTYDPLIDSWAELPLPGAAQSWARPAADRLPDGGVLALRGREVLRFAAGPPATVAALGDGLAAELREATLTVVSAHLAVAVGDGDPLAAVGIDPANGEELAIEQPPLGPRRGHGAARLSDGRLVVAGGGGVDEVFEDVEVFDPEEGTWELHAGLLAGLGRRSAPLIVLEDDRLVLVGGEDASGEPRVDAVVVDLARLRSTEVELAQPRLGHTVTLLPMGTLLIVGGEGRSGVPRETIEILRPPLP